MLFGFRDTTFRDGVAEVGHTIVAKSSELPTELELTFLTAHMVTHFEPFFLWNLHFGHGQEYFMSQCTLRSSIDRVSERDQLG
jgi:hypothetical protein